MVAEIQRQEVFYGMVLNVIEDDGEEWLTAEDIGKCLGFEKPRIYTLRIFHRNKDEFEGLSRVVKLTTRTKTGGFRPSKMTVFNAEAAVMFGFFAQTLKAKAFRQWASRFLTRGVEKIKTRLLALEEENKKLRYRQKALPEPVKARRLRELQSQVQETKDGALYLVARKDQTIKRLQSELAAAQKRIETMTPGQAAAAAVLPFRIMRMVKAMSALQVDLLALQEELQP